MQRLLSTDPVTGLTQTFNCDADGLVTIDTQQRFDGLLDQNERERNGFRMSNYRGDQQHMRKVAEIPSIIYDVMEQKFGPWAKNPQDWKKWLNDYDNRYFRTTGGQL